MKRLVWLLFAVLLAVWVLSGFVGHRVPPSNRLPANLDEFKQAPGGAATVDAGEFLFSLAKQGKLPGFAPGEHGVMHAGLVDGAGNNPAGTGPESYPISRGINFTKEGDASQYFYIVMQASNHAPWQLRKAWRADSNGNVLQNYTVP